MHEGRYLDSIHRVAQVTRHQPRVGVFDTHVGTGGAGASLIHTIAYKGDLATTVTQRIQCCSDMLCSIGRVKRQKSWQPRSEGP
jgi:predicted alpha-1,6-mannanase (GH76 family)